MAGELVGASFLSAFLQVLFDRIASRDVLEVLRGKRITDGLLNKLKITLMSVNEVVDDAEHKQITKPAIKEWLDELKDSVYQADDLFDEIAYEALRLKSEAEYDAGIIQVRTLFSNSLNLFKKGMMEVKLVDILDRLELLVKQKDVLGLREGIGEKTVSCKMPTTCLIDESEIYGRDDDKEAIMKLLLANDANRNHVGVIPIVGMGGVGKTALAQLVFNDDRAKMCFDLRIWVCVSEDFDVLKITRNMVEEISGKACGITTLNQLQLELQERLAEKKFLLVFDDVWNDQYVDWDILRRPLKAGAEGSKIVVTTRLERVALVMRSIPSHHHVNELTNDDTWFVFAKHAFNDGDVDAHPELEAIGRELVKKCLGLPLAAKSFGGLLRSTRDVAEWEKILRSNLWNLPNTKILPALMLSYQYLPSHLKRCFAYCAIFPKDYRFQRQELVLLWMAEGFIVPHDENRNLEEIGKQYFNDLVSRSFFQRSGIYGSVYVMHDLVNDLARFISGEFCCCLEDENSCDITKKTRHLLVAMRKQDASKKMETIYEANLRTFLMENHSQHLCHQLKEDNSHNLLPRLKHVRTLSLSGSDNVVELLESIGDSKHLRYLYLQLTGVQRLPQSVSCWYNLQTLILRGCENLIELPVNMRRLINLCHLDIMGAKLQSMPPEMGKLTKLHMLTDFFLGKASGSGLNDLGKLQHLRGQLAIHNLQNVLESQDALEARLKCKKDLKSLSLTWDSRSDDSRHERRILESLEPHEKIEYVSIEGYGGTRFPKWVGDPSFSSLTSLTLYGCRYCSTLPPLGQLASLRQLSVRYFDGIVVVGPEFYGSCISKMVPFASLESLIFTSIPQWQEWITSDQIGAFPLLQTLKIMHCPRLKKSLPDYLPSLTTLEIINCESFASSLPKAPNCLHVRLTGHTRNVLLEKFCLEVSNYHAIESLDDFLGLSNAYEQIDIINCDSLKCFPLELFPKIKKLDIRECGSLESLCAAEETQVYKLVSLGSLTIYGCHNLVSFPKGGISAPNLTQLSLWNCSKLKSLPNHMQSCINSLVDLKIKMCPELESFPEGGLPLKLQSLVIVGCDKLVAGFMRWNLQKLPSLSHFAIGECRDIESFPEENRLPPSLTCLEIAVLENLNSLNYNGLVQLTGLKELKIRFCSKLQRLPEGGLPSSLSSLFIYHCPELELFPEAGLPSKLETLEIICCNKLIIGRMRWNLQELQFLSHFSIAGCENVESFPEETLLPSTLASLKICRLQNLKSLNCNGLKCLTSLKKLEILSCHKLQSVPKEVLPSCVSLIIKNCLMTKRKKRNGLTMDIAMSKTFSNACCLSSILPTARMSQ